MSKAHEMCVQIVKNKFRLMIPRKEALRHPLKTPTWYLEAVLNSKVAKQKVKRLEIWDEQVSVDVWGDESSRTYTTAYWRWETAQSDLTPIA